MTDYTLLAEHPLKEPNITSTGMGMLYQLPYNISIEIYKDISVSFENFKAIICYTFNDDTISGKIELIANANDLSTLSCRIMFAAAEFPRNVRDVLLKTLPDVINEAMVKV